MASKGFKPRSQALEEFCIIANYVEALAFSRYLNLRGSSARSRAF
jgi:hypothetical protein